MAEMKKDNGGKGTQPKGGSDKPKTAEEKQKIAEEQLKNTVTGKVTGKSLEQQAKEARGEAGDEGKDREKEMLEYKSGEDKQAEKLLEEAFPERKAVDIRLEGRRKFIEKFPEADPNKPSGGFRVEVADDLKGEKLYKGKLTLQSVHEETHERIAFPIVIEGPARGEGYLFYCMKQAHPHAMREHFEIDAENVTDPLLRTRYE